jgi:hypothetical protein
LKKWTFSPQNFPSKGTGIKRISAARAESCRYLGFVASLDPEVLLAEASSVLHLVAQEKGSEIPLCYCFWGLLKTGTYAVSCHAIFFMLA